MRRVITTSITGRGIIYCSPAPRRHRITAPSATAATLGVRLASLDAATYRTPVISTAGPPTIGPGSMSTLAPLRPNRPARASRLVRPPYHVCAAYCQPRRAQRCSGWAVRECLARRVPQLCRHVRWHRCGHGCALCCVGCARARGRLAGVQGGVSGLSAAGQRLGVKSQLCA
ncbi:hypothetical protein BD779DRAFT_1521506 [Infundibulicybe gibba]|nr:hypothetical protein BD779DRAFT_1521506 [Infundibulicybe gibba]